MFSELKEALYISTRSIRFPEKLTMYRSLVMYREKGSNKLS